MRLSLTCLTCPIRLIGAGLAIGVPLAIGAERVLSSQIYGVRGMDAISYGGASPLLVVVTFLTGFVPARRASRLDPLTVMRTD